MQNNFPKTMAKRAARFLYRLVRALARNSGLDCRRADMELPSDTDQGDSCSEGEVCSTLRSCCSHSELLVVSTATVLTCWVVGGHSAPLGFLPAGCAAMPCDASELLVLQ